MDEAGDMLTLPPGLADIAEDEEGGRAAAGLKKKEWDRARTENGKGCQIWQGRRGHGF